MINSISKANNIPFVKGVIYTIISAVVYGFTPILAKLTYADGNNAITLTFFRVVFAVPFLYFGVSKSKSNLKITRKEFFDLLVISFLGVGITTTTLYASYNYISVGMATTIHFIYPSVVYLVSISSVVYLVSILFFKEKINFKTLTALIFSMVGISILSNEIIGGNLYGVFLSALSGITYGLFLVYLDKSGLKNMNPFKTTMYISLINIVGLFAFGQFTGELIFSHTPMVWVFIILISLLTSIFGVAFLQLGVKYCGATTASILSTFEPITSVIFGFIFLNEDITIFKMIGSIFIIIAVLLLAVKLK